MLNRADLFAKKDRRYVDVPVNGTTARLRSLTAAEMRRLRASMIDDKGLANDRAERIPELLTIHTMVDEQGQPVLTEHDLANFDQLDALYVTVLGRAALEHTGWNADYDGEAIMDAVGNSEGTD